MSKLTLNTILIGVLASFSLAALAQPGDQDKAVAKLRVDKGVVMTSKGGEFATAGTGEGLIKDERLMVSKESSATVIYNDHCERTYSDPGVYKIDAECKVAAVWGTGATVAVIAGAVAVGVVVDNNNKHKKPPPVSR
jgi:hypothetical protein